VLLREKKLEEINLSRIFNTLINETGVEEASSSFSDSGSLLYHRHVDCPHILKRRVWEELKSGCIKNNITQRTKSSPTEGGTQDFAIVIGMKAAMTIYEVVSLIGNSEF